MWKVIQEFIYLDSVLYGIRVHMLLKSLRPETSSNIVALFLLQ